MGATKRLYEQMFDKYDNLEANFRILEEQYFMYEKTKQNETKKTI